MFVPSFNDCNKELLALIRQNIRVIGWEMLGKDAPEFEPYFTVRITSDWNSQHFFWTTEKYDEFASKWIAENFSNGLPPIAPGYMYRISWHPTYTLKSTDSDNATAFVDYDGQFTVHWQPTLVALSQEEDGTPWYYVWDNNKRCWIEHPMLTTPDVLQKNGLDISNKKDMCRNTFCDFDYILFMYKIKNFYPSWWDLT